MLKHASKGKEFLDEHGVKLRVLLAEAHAEVRSALELLVEQELHMRIVDEVAAASSLLRCTGDTQPDLILLDWDLPGLPRSTCIADLRDCCPSARIVALSGKPEARQSCLAAGADAFADEGLSPTCLLDTLRSLTEY
jgi:DNA-binding NarL/FixJ family response regulator